MSNAKELKLVTARNEKILEAIKKGELEKAIDTVCQHLDENNGRYSAVAMDKAKGISTGVLTLGNTSFFSCKVVFKDMSGVERPLFTVRYNNDLTIDITSIDEGWKQGEFEALFLAMDKGEIH